MDQVTVTIDGTDYKVAPDTPILDAATQQGIRIPTLCKLKELDPNANCRMCVVEVEGARGLVTACSAAVRDGMVIDTQSDKVQRSRKLTVELMFARHAVDCHHCLRNGHSKPADLDKTFCEMCFFCDCVRDGFCELQDLAREHDVGVLPFEIETDNHVIDDSTGSITMNRNKCIMCRRCVDVCAQVQDVHALVAEGRGSDLRIVPAFGETLATSDCIQCGKCVEVCPTGSLFFKEQIEELLYFTHDYETTTVAQISDDIIPQLATLFGMDPSEVKLDRVASGLRKVGVDHVMFEDRARAMAMHQRDRRLAEKLEQSDGPVILTDSRSAVTFLRNRFARLEGQLVQYPTTQQIFGDYVRDTYLVDRQLQPEHVRTISVTDNSERAPEAVATHSVDFCLNARQLYRLFLRTGVDIRQSYPDGDLLNLVNIEEPEVSEAGDLLPKADWTMDQTPVISEIEVEGRTLKLATATNLGQAAALLEEVQHKTSTYDIIRIVQ